MASCPGRIEDISAFLDGELDRDEELELRRHLDDCELCTAWHDRLELFSEGLARSLGRERAPASLARRVGGLRRPTWPQRVGIGLAGMAAVFAAALLLDRTTDGTDGANGQGEWEVDGFLHQGAVDPRSERHAAAALQLIEDHHRWTSGETTLVVSSSDASEIARGLSARLPFRVGVAGITGARLRGGQDCSLTEGRAAYLQYERAGELVSVFVAPHLVAGTDDGHGEGDEGSGSTGEASCRRIADNVLCTFRGPRETVAVVATRPETARSFQRAAWIVDPPGYGDPSGYGDR
jgi:anti-sigma factor RsiW